MREKALCHAVAQMWASHQGLPPLTCVYPDALIRNIPAVDLLGNDSPGRSVLVLEHTMVESFPGQLSKQIAAITLFRPLERLLVGKLPLPGRYDLAIAPGAVLGLKGRTGDVRAWVSDWVISVAPTLVIHRHGQPLRHFKSARVPDTKLDVTLYRWPGSQGGMRLVFDAPEDREAQRDAVLAKSLRDKCAKLAAAKANARAETSLLLLEIADMALGNLFDLDELVARRAPSEIVPLPDSIWIVDTTDHPASVMISREGNRRLSEHVDRFLPSALDWQEGNPTT